MGQAGIAMCCSVVLALDANDQWAAVTCPTDRGCYCDKLQVVVPHPFCCCCHTAALLQAIPVDTEEPLERHIKGDWQYQLGLLDRSGCNAREPGVYGVYVEYFLFRL